LSTTTIAEAITALLSSKWGLGAPLAAGDIHFDTGWVDRQWIGQSAASPQIIATGPVDSPIRHFGKKTVGAAGKHHLLSYEIYLINVWVRVPAGADGDTEEDYAESMRREVVDIINENCITTPSGVTYLTPLDRGRAIHERERTPRVFRFEITVQANYQP